MLSYLILCYIILYYVILSYSLYYSIIKAGGLLWVPAKRRHGEGVVAGSLATFPLNPFERGLFLNPTP